MFSDAKILSEFKPNWNQNNKCFIIITINPCLYKWSKRWLCLNLLVNYSMMMFQFDSNQEINNTIARPTCISADGIFEILPINLASRQLHPYAASKEIWTNLLPKPYKASEYVKSSDASLNKINRSKLGLFSDVKFCHRGV